MTLIQRLNTSQILSPRHAYELAEWQKRRMGEAFRARILRLYTFMAANPSAFSQALLHEPQQRRVACLAAKRSIAGAGVPGDETICEAYRDLVMSLGVKKINPALSSFSHDLVQFYLNYLKNFPLPAEQEPLSVFRTLLSAPSRHSGYLALCYSVTCPLTGLYMMGAAFVIQPQSNSALLVYAFANPEARGIGRFAKRLLGLVREESRAAIEAYFDRQPERRPAYHDPSGPLILFERNIIEDMTLEDILMDSAGIDIDRPPTAESRLTASAIGQRTRDLVWHRCGARLVDYKPPQQTLKQHLRSRTPGYTALSLCAFSPPGKDTLPAEQVRSAMGDDIYFRTRIESLAENSMGNQIPLKPIVSNQASPADFQCAEDETKRMLEGLTWEVLRHGRDRPYREWLADKRPPRSNPQRP